jgi:hypothetical protein
LLWRRVHYDDFDPNWSTHPPFFPIQKLQQSEHPSSKHKMKFSKVTTIVTFLSTPQSIFIAMD